MHPSTSIPGNIQLSIGRTFSLCSQPQYRLKGRHWVGPAIVTEHEFVHVSLHVLRADSVVRTQNPSLEVSGSSAECVGELWLG